MSHNRFLTTLDRIEALGNRLPAPAWLFVWLCALVAVLSSIAAFVGWEATYPDGSKTVTAINLISVDGLNRIFTQTVSNFTGFAPVGPVLVAMLGLGIAERSGLLGAALASFVRLTKGRGLAFLVAFTGVMSSIAMDAGYVVVIPLAGLLFLQAGLPPLAGIACAFAGVSGGFAANLLIGPTDAMLAGLTTEAARTLSPDNEVAITANYYFMAASTFLVAIVVTAVNHYFVLPRLQADSTYSPIANNDIATLNATGAKAVLLWTLLVVGFLLSGLVPEAGFLRAEDGSLTKSPAIQGVVVLIAVYAGVAGILYARFSGLWRSSQEAVNAMEETMRTMAGYLVLMFFAAQFVAWFQWSQLGSLVAISGAEGLRQIDLSPVLLLLAFVLLTVLLDLLIGSASAKWALMAPVFVPMFMLVGIAPEATQAAYRVGDSVANIITPLMPYFAMVVAFAQRFKPDAGIGTLMAMMLPYSLALCLSWSLLLSLWVGFGWSFGPQ